MRSCCRAVLVGLLVLPTGCAAPQDGSVTSPPSAASPSADSSSEAVAPDLDITVAGGRVTPVNAALEATVGHPITLKVTSDVADELHVHAIPERTFTVRPGVSETFEFTVEVPGRVDVELHELHRTVVTIQVRP